MLQPVIADDDIDFGMGGAQRMRGCRAVGAHPYRAAGPAREQTGFIAVIPCCAIGRHGAGGLSRYWGAATPALSGAELAATGLPAGEMRARQVKRLPRKEFDSTVEMWLAPILQHLPVRLRVTQANGDVADQQLSRMP